jgi:hypothetical protein
VTATAQVNGVRLHLALEGHGPLVALRLSGSDLGPAPVGI